MFIMMGHWKFVDSAMTIAAHGILLGVDRSMVFGAQSSKTKTLLHTHKQKVHYLLFISQRSTCCRSCVNNSIILLILHGCEQGCSRCWLACCCTTYSMHGFANSV